MAYLFRPEHKPSIPKAGASLPNSLSLTLLSPTFSEAPLAGHISFEPLPPVTPTDSLDSLTGHLVNNTPQVAETESKETTSKERTLVPFSVDRFNSKRNTVILLSTNNGDFKELAPQVLPSTIRSVGEAYNAAGQANAQVLIIETDSHQRTSIKLTKIVLRELLENLRKTNDYYDKLTRRISSLIANIGKPPKKKGGAPELTCQQLIGKIRELRSNSSGDTKRESGTETPIAKKPAIDAHQEKLDESTTEILRRSLKNLKPDKFKITYFSSDPNRQQGRLEQLKPILQRSHQISSGKESKDSEKTHVLVTALADLEHELTKIYGTEAAKKVPESLATHTKQLEDLARARTWEFLQGQESYKHLPAELKMAPHRDQAIAIARKKIPELASDEKSIVIDSFDAILQSIESSIHALEHRSTLPSAEEVAKLKASLLQQINTLYISLIEELLIAAHAKTREYMLHYLAEECIAIGHFRRTTNFLYIAGQADEFAADVYSLLERVFQRVVSSTGMALETPPPILDITEHSVLFTPQPSPFPVEQEREFPPPFVHVDLPAAAMSAMSAEGSNKPGRLPASLSADAITQHGGIGKIAGAHFSALLGSRPSLLSPTTVLEPSQLPKLTVV